jgi:hypothetical protein
VRPRCEGSRNSNATQHAAPSHFAVWNGTLSEQLALMAALPHNCECSYASDATVTLCSAHVMLARDHRGLNGLLWNGYPVRRLLLEEEISTS